MLSEYFGVISPDFEKFVQWFDGLTEENQLSADEIAISNEMKAMGTFLDDIDSVHKNIEQMIGESMPIHRKIDDLRDEVNDYRDSEEAFVDMLAKASGTDSKMDMELNRLSSECHQLELETESLVQNCKENARILEELCAKNIENRNKLFTSFSGQHSSSGVRWCGVDLDNYLIGCNNVALLLNQRFEEKLRLMSFADPEKQKLRCGYDLQNLETIFIGNASVRFDTECDLKKVNVLMDFLSKPFQPMSYSLMREQIPRLSLQNEDTEENLENLEAAIHEKIKYLAYQEAKICEKENNKEKLQTSAKRLDILKQVCKPISDSLLLGDLLWVLLHSEMEQMKNILENISTSRYEEENKQCARNLQILTKISTNATDDHVAKEFLNKLSKLMADDIDAKPDDDLSNPVAMYNESAVHHEMQLRHAISDSYQMKIVNLLDNFNAMSARMNVFIGNGPSDKPTIWNLSILADLEVYRRKYSLMFDSSRTMLHNYIEKYHQPFDNDDLWKRRQLLWIWFLTDQKTFLRVFENTVGDSKKTINHSGKGSIVGGIKRQQ